MEKQPRNLHELILISADEAMDRQQRNGSFPSGNNNVYQEDETPVRNTAHWLITLLKAHDITGETSYRNAAQQAAEYLISEKSRPYGVTFHSRKVEHKTQCDGLVGQSTPIRALGKAGLYLNNEKYTKTAKEVFLKHPFSQRLGLWEVVEIDGDYKSYDRTLNHQVLFAAAGAEIAEICDEIRDQVGLFLSKLPSMTKTRENGLIRHYVYPSVHKAVGEIVRNPRHISLLRNYMTFPYHTVSKRRKLKEVGYYPTILSALATIRKHLPRHEIWESQFFERILEFSDTTTYERHVSEKYSQYGSMLPGFNQARILYYLKGNHDENLSQWIQREIRRTYDPETQQLRNNTSDPNTQAALVSSITDLPNVLIN